MGALAGRLRALTGNRWAMAGLAGAAGLGAVALARSRGSGASPPSAEVEGATAEAGQMAGAAFTGQAFPNTYATDLAAAVGDLDGRYADEVATYSAASAANATALDALSKANAKQQTSIDAVTKKVASIKPAPPAKAKPAPKPKTKTQVYKKITVTPRPKQAPTVGYGPIPKAGR